MPTPRLHGLNRNFRLENFLCDVLKVDCCLSSLDASDWSSPLELAKAYLKHHGTSESDPQKVLKTFTNSFNTISLKRKKHLALFAYCEDIRDFLGTAAVRSDFAQHYTDQRLEMMAKMDGYYNGKRLAILGGEQYKNELDQRIGNAKRQPTAAAAAAAASNTDGTGTASTTPAGTVSPTAATTAIEPDQSTVLGKRDRNNSDNENERLSVATIIKEQAINKHAKFQQGANLSVSDRKIMSCGLSSILDLVDLSATGQQSLFPQHGLEHIKASMMKRFHSSPYVIPTKVVEIWNIIVAVSTRNNGLDAGRAYLSKIRTSSPKFVRVFEVMMDILENQKVILDSNLSSRVTEYDYLLKIWGPILEAIIAINGGMIRLKSCESVNSNSSQAKRELYDNDNAMGFKVDIRFVYDGRKDEYDVGAGEVAKNSMEHKLYHDFGKLVREGKDVLDGLLNIVLDTDTARSTSAWVIQICGLQGQLSSLHLAQDGLYVAIPQSKFRFPSSISTMDCFLKTLESLSTFVANMESCAHGIESALEEFQNRRSSMGKKFNRSRSPLPGHITTSWMRPTWYSPSRNQQHLSRMPHGLFRKSMDNNDDDLNLEQEQQDNDDDDGDRARTTQANDLDEYGWYVDNDGQWRNEWTGACSDATPYD